MSRSGILVQWQADRPVVNLPNPGDVLSVDVELPANHSFGRRCINCQAVVTRVSTGENGARVAFQVSQMQFRNYTNGKRSNANPDEFSCSLM